MLTIAHSGFSTPSAQRIGEQGEVILVRSSTVEADVNWGRAVANTHLNPLTEFVTNKRIMRQKFAAAGVPMPPLRTLDEVRAGIGPGFRVLGRPDRHSKGRGMWHITTEADLTKALAGTRRKRAATHFMDWVYGEREYRVHVFRGKSIRISRKDYAPDGKEWKAVKPGDINVSQIRQAAKDAVAAVGLDFGAVDVLAGGPQNQDVWVLEVNSAPGLGGTMPSVYYRAFTQWKADQ